jgi:hypothetical protein
MTTAIKLRNQKLAGQSEGDIVNRVRIPVLDKSSCINQEAHMRNLGRNVMKSVKLNKKELLSIVRENKAKHIAEYNEAVKDYIEAARTIVNYNVSQINEGTLVSIAKCKLIPTAPTSYEDEYDRAIRMLELSIEKEIELEADVFNQLVLDEWQWKNNFAVMASTYKAFQ